MGSAYQIEPLTLSGLETLLSWSAWAPGPSDAACFWAADPDGFLGAHADGRLVGGVAAVRYGSRFGFLGPIWTAPGYPGRDFEEPLIRRALDHLGARVVGHVRHEAIAAPEGFTLAHKQIRFVGKAGGLRGRGNRQTLSGRGSIVAVDKLPTSVLHGLDSLYFPGPRAAFLKEWIRAPAHRAVGWLENGPAKSLKGYGVARPGPQGHRIGPLFAKSPEIALALLEELTETLPGDEPVVWDLPQPNRPAVRIAQEAGLEAVMETERCYRNGKVSIAPETVYGLTSLELG